MSLRFKILFFSFFMFIGYMGLIFAAQRLIFYPKFMELEKKEAIQDIKRARFAIEREIYHLESLAADWGYWDDTYEFMKDRNIHYIESNLDQSVFTDIEVNLLYFVDLKGKVIWGNSYDLERKKKIRLRDFPEKLPKGHFGVLSESDTKSRSGSVQTEEGVMLVTATPVRRSNGKGPTRGAVIMGRLLSGKKISEMAERIQVEISIHRISDMSRSSAINKVLEDISSDADHQLVWEASKDLNRGYDIFKDVYNRPAFVLEADISRDISKQGKNAIIAGIILLGVIGLIIAVINYFLLKSMVTGPLSRLSGHMASIEQEGPIHPYEEGDKRKDEIGVLTQQFNFLALQVNHQVEEQKRLIGSLKKAIEEIKTLKGIIPICASCKKIRDDKGYWQQIETYIKSHSDVDFSHGICPDCQKKLYPDINIDNRED